MHLAFEAEVSNHQRKRHGEISVIRVLPQRWTSVLLLAAFGLAGGLFVGIRTPHLVEAAAIGLAIGIVTGAILLIAFAGNDTRLIQLRQSHPEAIVVQGLRDPDVSAWLMAGAGQLFSELGIGSLFSIIFDRTGISFWKGTTKPTRFASFPWREVTELSLGDLYSHSQFKSRIFYHRIVLRLTRDDTSVILPFGVERVPVWGNRPRLNEAELLDLLAEVDAARGIPSRQPIAPSYVSAGLVDGRTAWSAQRLLGISNRIIGLVGSPILFVGLAGLVFGWLPPIVSILLLLVGVASQVISFIGLREESAATARERAAGYTTLNGVELAFEQRHPRTGLVIRPAGAQALSGRSFADLMR